MSKDQIWKRVIEKFFSKFTEFFLPELHTNIDFKYKPKFLDNELLKISQKSGGKNRSSDKLVEIKLKDGTDRCILVHIEVQDSKNDDFIFRMFQYHYRILDKLNKEIVALAIYTDSNLKFKPNEYHKEFYGTEISYKFNIYKILEQKDRKEDLKNSNNPFALIILSSLYYLESKKNDDKRYNFKLELTKLLLEKSYKRKDIYELFEFINVLMNFIDIDLESKFYKEINEMPRTKEKQLISSFKKIAMKEKSTEIAKNLKNKGFSLIDISETTGLTKEEIEKL
ncbi:MAG: hypothetical protein H7263_17890 [Candidatus Sericytochromatia bacterium]|nr:hypothetical protein [Candidatus Sericytochromatia bacterium]